MNDIRTFFFKLIKHDLAVPFVIGILIRIVLIPFFGNSTDIGSYYLNLTWFSNGYNPYSTHYGLYPPLTYLIPFILIFFSRILGVNPVAKYVVEAANTGSVTGMVSPYQASPAFLIIWKMPTFIFDVLTAILIYKFVKELSGKQKVSKIAFSLWFLNPITLSILYLHGAYDGIAGFFILLGVYLLYKGHNFSAGASFSLGVLTKISPVYIALPLTALILFRGIRTKNFSFRKNFICSFRFVLGFSLPILLMLPMLIDYFKITYFSVSKEVAYTAGLNQWFFVQDHWSWAANASKIFEKISLFYPVLSIVLAIVFPFLLPNKFSQQKNYYVIYSLLFTCLTYIFIGIKVQPQYLIWIIPLLICVVSIKASLLIPLCIISIGVPLFLFSLQGFYAVAYPLSVFTGLINIEEISNNIITYLSIPGFTCSSLQGDLLLISSGLVFIGEILIICIILFNLYKSWRSSTFEK